MPKYAIVMLAAAAMFAVAGCFDEPIPAYKAVPEGARVYLAEKGLVTLAGQKFDAAKVDYLNLDRNQLTNVDAVASLVNLKWLRLNGNRLTALPDLKALTKLRRIYLADNRLTTVPETLKDLPVLTDVELSGNSALKEVPAWLAQKKGLENVSLNRTGVTRLPDDLSAWNSLKALQLGGLAIEAAEMARIRKALPGVAIVF